VKDADAIHDAAAMDIKKRLKVIKMSVTPRALYPLLDKKLFAVFTERRKRGARISRSWMQTRAKLMFKDLYPDSKFVFKASRGWVRRFCKRKSITRRRRTHMKKADVEDKLPAVRRFIQGLIKLNSSSPRRDPVWGRFPPESRYNLDQVPLPFIGTDANATYEHTGAKVVWVRAPGSGVEKRFASLQVRPISPSFSHPTLCTLLFLGLGRKHSASSFR